MFSRAAIDSVRLFSTSVSVPSALAATSINSGRDPSKWLSTNPLTVERAGQRTRVAVDAKDGRLHIGAGLMRDKAPGLFVLGPAGLDDPHAVDRRNAALGRRLGGGSLGPEGIRAARSQILAFELAVLDGDPELGAVLVVGERDGCRSR